MGATEAKFATRIKRVSGAMEAKVAKVEVLV